MGQAMKAHGTFKLADAQDYDEAIFEVCDIALFSSTLTYVSFRNKHKATYDSSLQEIQTAIQEQLVALLEDPSSVVKRAILHNISSLCVFFGRQKTNDVLLSHIITYLNDRDWPLRYAFFESVVGIATCVGSRSLEEYILPLMIQALSGVYSQPKLP